MNLLQALLGWPQPKPKEPTIEERKIAKLQQWRAIGAEFQYLNRTMIVTGHWRDCLGAGWTIYSAPCLQANYADDTGRIREIEFSYSEALAIMRAQP